MKISILLPLVLLAAFPDRAAAIERGDLIGQDTVITLPEAVELALSNNLDIAVARIEPALSLERVREASGSFDPVLFGGASFEHTETAIASNFLSFFGTTGTVREDIWTYSSGLQGVVPWGMEYESNVSLVRTDTTSGVTSIKPEYRAVWTNQITLPLLKNFLRNDARLAVRTSRIGSDISAEDFRRELTDIVVGVEQAYWNLAAERASRRVAAKSLEAASSLLEQTNVRHEVGVVSRVEVTEAEAGVADREFRFIQARNRAATAEDTLLQAILAPDQRAYATTRVRTQEPTFIPYDVDADVALERALSTRPELISARRRVDDAEVRLAHARNQRLPDLDLAASFTNSGLSGEPKTGTIAGLPEHGREAFNDFFSDDGNHGWLVGANFSYPLGNDTAQARHTQRNIELRRATTELRRAEQNVILDVRNAVRNVQDAQDGVRAAERRKASETERLRAEQERLRLGDSTPQEVLEIEEDLVDAERQQIEALRAYRISIAELERAQATLLETRGISVGVAR